MTDRRRMIINPPLTEAEFAQFCAANPDLEIDRYPNGVIVMNRKPKCRDEYADWLLSQRGTVSSEIDLGDDRPGFGTKIHRIAQDREHLQALVALRDRLIRLRETSDGAHAAALQVAIRALVSAIDILDSVTAHEQGMPQRVTSRDMDTYDQCREFLTDVDQSVEKALEMLGGDPAKRNLAERIHRLVEGVVFDPEAYLDKEDLPSGEISSREPIADAEPSRRAPLPGYSRWPN